jgi:hypothetical protein
MRGPFGSLIAQLSKNGIKKRFPHRFLLSSGALFTLHSACQVGTSGPVPLWNTSKPLLINNLAARAYFMAVPKVCPVPKYLLSDQIAMLSVRILEQFQFGCEIDAKL